MAPIMSMCTVEQSGGIVMVRERAFFPQTFDPVSGPPPQLSPLHILIVALSIQTSGCLLEVA